MMRPYTLIRAERLPRIEPVLPTVSPVTTILHEIVSKVVPIRR